ncbi:hypothetical protein ON010_g3702 [Phytophthora cinnamomi]|nr:hypothetical protein ON010_g3702 [Phytophthora cinnamomi]
MVLSLVAFAFLQCHPWAQEVKVLEEKGLSATGSVQDHKEQHDLELDERADQEAEEDTLLSQSSCGSCPNSSSASTVTIPSPSSSSQSAGAISGAAEFRQVWPLLACQWVLAAFSFGWLPSTMPYVYKKFAVRFAATSYFIADISLLLTEVFGMKPIDDAEAATARFQTTASLAALILSPLASIITT